MPRDPKAVALQRLATIQANWATAYQASAKLTEQRRAAIVAAVEAGCTKASVARVAGVTYERIRFMCRDI